MIETWLYREYGPSTLLLTNIITVASSLGFILFKFGEEFHDDDGRLYGLDVVFTKPGVLNASRVGQPCRRPDFEMKLQVMFIKCGYA